MPNLISASLTTANKNDIKAHLDGVKLICSFLLNLTPKDRQKVYKMGNKSVAFVSKALQALQANPAVVPAAFQLSEFEKDYQLYLDLQFVLANIGPLMEGLQDTKLLLGSELMRQGVSAYKIINDAARTNSSLDTIAKELGVRFKRSGKLQPVVHILQPRQSVTLHGIMPRRLFKTLNQCTVLLYRGEAAKGKNKIVGGNSKLVIPTGWTTMTIFNNDAEAPAVISLIQK